MKIERPTPTRELATMTTAEAAELVKLIESHTPHEKPTDDEITITSKAAGDGGLMMDADVALVIGFECRCFEGDLLLFHGGGAMIQDSDSTSGDLTRIGNVAEVVFWLAERGFNLSPKEFAPVDED